MLNLNVNVGRKLIVCGEGKVKLQHFLVDILNGYVLCLSLQKCKEEGGHPQFCRVSVLKNIQTVFCLGTCSN